MVKLEEIVQAEAASEIDAILAEADSRARQIISEAENRAEARLAESRKRIEAQARAAIQQARSAAELMIATARTQARGEMMDLVRQNVSTGLQKASAQPDYGRILQALAEEALLAALPAEAIVVHPDDREHLDNWARQQELELRTDPELHLGVRLVSSSGRKVENTLTERLQRGWDTLAIRVAKMLWD
jgi:V/A-type H+-transporting ATPase subunit E